MNLYIKNHLSSILLGVVFLCLYSCASFNLSKRSQNNRQSQIKGLQAFQEEDDPIDDGLEQTRSTNLFTVDQNDPRYYSTTYQEEYWGEELTPYNKVKGNLLLAAQTEILGIIRTEIKSVLIDKQLAINDNYKGIINSQIEARVEGVLTSDYYAFDVRPKLFEIKKGDTLELIARFDKVAHKEKLEIDKKDNEQLAKDSFERAYDSYSKGIMYKCLEDMALCHYAIYSGGNNKKIYDPILNRDGPIVEALYSLAGEIGRSISVDVLDADGYPTENNKIQYTRSQPFKILPIEIRWYGESDQNIGGVKIKITDTSDGQVEERNVGDSHKLDIDLLDYLENNKDSRSDFNISFEILLTLTDATGVKIWKNSKDYRDFNKKLLDKNVIVEDITFPQQKVIFIDRFLYNGVSKSPRQFQNELDRAKSLIKQKGSEFFKDMIGVGDVTPTSADEIKRSLEKGERPDDTYGLDGVIELKIERSETFDEITISYFRMDNFQQPKIVKGAKALGIMAMGTIVVEDAVMKFFDHYLFRTIKFKNGTKNTQVTVERIKNNQPVGGSSKSFRENTILRYPDQSRYHNLKYRFSADGYRSKEIVVPSDYLDFTNMLADQPQRFYDTKEYKIVLKKSQGIANIVIESNNWSMLANKSTLANTEMKFGKKGRLFKHKWDKKTIKGKLNHTYENSTGRYYVKISAPGFKKQREVPFDIRDSDQPVTVPIQLIYKSKLKAFGYSTFAPGLGHLYMEKLKIRNALLPLGIYGISVATAINSNASYNRHRSDFETYQGISITSLDPVLSSVNKEKAQKSWDKMGRADDMFIGAVVSAIITNIATSLWLILSS